MTLIWYPKCGTCRKAKAWLEAQGFAPALRDIAVEKPTRAELAAWTAAAGIPMKKWFNTSGLRYRELELSKKLPDMTEEQMLDLLATDGMLVKRPILLPDSGAVLVGFKEADWAAALK